MQLSCGFNCRSTCLFRGWKLQLPCRIWVKVKQRNGPSKTGIFPNIWQILASWRLFSPLELTLADAFKCHQTCLFRGWKLQLPVQLKRAEITKIYRNTKSITKSLCPDAHLRISARISNQKYVRGNARVTAFSGASFCNSRAEIV